MAKEDKLQASMVLWFSQNKTKDRGCLWSVRNTTLSPQDGMKQKAMGMFAGVSDLIHFKEGAMTGIEVKALETRHSILHLQQQIFWGRKIISQGGGYYFCYDLDGFTRLINGDSSGCWTIEEMEEKISKTKTKTVAL